MTTKTPYDEELRGLIALDRPLAPELRKARNECEANRQGYLRALADTQPRIDALVAALQDLSDAAAEHIVEMDKVMKLSASNERGRTIAHLIGRLQLAQEEAGAALKLVGEPLGS